MQISSKTNARHIRQRDSVPAQFKMNVHVILTVIKMMATSAALTAADDSAERKLVGMARLQLYLIVVFWYASAVY